MVTSLNMMIHIQAYDKVVTYQHLLAIDCLVLNKSPSPYEIPFSVFHPTSWLYDNLPSSDFPGSMHRSGGSVRDRNCPAKEVVRQLHLPQQPEAQCHGLRHAPEYESP